MFRRSKSAETETRPAQPRPRSVTGSAQKVEAKIEGNIVNKKTAKTLEPEKRVPRAPAGKKRRGAPTEPEFDVTPALVEDTETLTQGTRFHLPGLPALGRLLEQVATFRSRLTITGGKNVSVEAEPSLGAKASLWVDDDGPGTSFDRADIGAAGFFQDHRVTATRGNTIDRETVTNTRRGRLHLRVDNFRGNGGASLSADGVSFNVGLGKKNSAEPEENE